MPNEAKLSDTYWKDGLYTTFYKLNRGKIRVNKDKNPYELWGIPTSIKCFRVFESNCYIKRNGDDLGKFDSRIDEGIFLGYSSNKTEYRCYNKRLHKIIETAAVRINDIKPIRTRSHDGDENTNNEEEEDLQKDESIHDEE